MKDFDNFELQQINQNGLRTVVDWARQKGRHREEYNAKVFWIKGPEGYYGSCLDDELIAGGTAVSCSGEFGFLGLFIESPDFRETGIGRTLWTLR